MNEDVSVEDIFCIMAGTLNVRDIYIRREAAKWLVEQKKYEQHFDGNYTTPALLSLFKRCVRYNCQDITYELRNIKLLNLNSLPSSYIVSAMKKVLNTRPHVPNAPEKKIIRQKLAKANYGSGKSKNK